MNFNLVDRTILLTVTGSRAYGMSQESSDVDLKGIAIPTKEYYFGFLNKFEQADKASHMMSYYDYLTDAEKEKADQGELEGSVYDINKFFHLAASNNPNILDLLFCREEEIRINTQFSWYLRDNAQDFLSTKCRWTFGGYAKAQLKRIKLHRGYLLNPPIYKPTREEYNLPERTLIPKDQLAAAQAAIRKKIDSWEVDFGTMDDSEKIYIQDQLSSHWSEMELGADEKFAAAARAVGYDENFILLLDKERRYNAAKTSWFQYQNWKENRNPERAALEAKFGIDCKHASHLVRLLRMCREILETKKVNVYREDAAELLSIRNGAWDYDRLMEFVQEEEVRIDEAYKKSTLPKSPDRNKLDKLCIALVERGLKG